MAQYITLEEAALRLGIPTDDFKRRLKTEWTHLVPMRDGPTLRFRLNQIEELARQLGAASDPGLPLAALDESPTPGSDDFKVSPTQPAAPADEPLDFGGSTDEDVFALAADEPQPPAPGKPSKPGKAGGADSNVRLESGKAAPKKDEAAVVPTEEIALDLSGPGSSVVIKGGSSAKLSAPKSSSSKLSASDSGSKGLSSPGGGESSEFELSLDADSDDFQLQLNADSSDEVDLSPPKSGKRAGESGINLRDPADSGIPLEKKGAKKPPEDESDDFELSLDPAPAPGKSGPRHGSGPKHGSSKSTPRAAKPPVTSDSDSEFELTLDDSGDGSSLEAAALEAEEGKGDIFETDFEIPPMSDESGSEAVALESDTDLEGQSDFELAMNESDVGGDADDTGSQVVLLEDEADVGASADVDLADVEVEEEESAAAALRGSKVRRRDEDEEEEEAAPAAVAAPASWGAFPTVVLGIAMIPVFFGMLMGFELLHTMWGYQQPRKPAAPITSWVAQTLDMPLKDQ